MYLCVGKRSTNQIRQMKCVDSHCKIYDCWHRRSICGINIGKVCFIHNEKFRKCLRDIFSLLIAVRGLLSTNILELIFNLNFVNWFLSAEGKRWWFTLNRKRHSLLLFYLSFVAGFVFTIFIT